MKIKKQGDNAASAPQRANLVIIGTSGHAKVVYETFVLALAKKYKLAGLITSDRISSFLDMPVLGSEKDAEKIFKKYKITHAFVAIGAGFSRERLSIELLAKNRIRAVNIIHPGAIIARNIKMGAGNFIGPGAIINPYASIGDHCLINSGAIVEHDCVIDDFATLSPGVILGGKSVIGKRSFIGLGANIIHKIRIGEDAVIGASAVVVSDIQARSVAAGCPAKVFKKRKIDEVYL
ncbi:MAG: acetyltransferase [Candidatus Omnitrophota bacterium]|nr:acetyltransferase [Candidatus Omnitrophota bacterium]